MIEILAAKREEVLISVHLHPDFEFRVSLDETKKRVELKERLGLLWSDYLGLHRCRTSVEEDYLLPVDMVQQTDFEIIQRFLHVDGNFNALASKLRKSHELQR